LHRRHSVSTVSIRFPSIPFFEALFLSLSEKAIGEPIDWASVSQKFSSFFEGLSSGILEVIRAALIAPIEVPATISNYLPCFERALYTPHSYAPRDPPPRMTSTVSTH